MADEVIFGGRIGAQVLYATLEGGAKVPLLATDNGDGTYTLKVDSELTATIDPSGLATAAKQDASKETLDDIKDGIDELKTGIILGAGTNVIGRSGATQFFVTGNFSRPAEATAYAAGDAVTNSTSAPTVLELALDAEGAADGQNILITGCQVVVGSKWASLPWFNLWIANATFAATNDNSALSIADETARTAIMIPLEKTGYTGANSVAALDGRYYPYRLAAADKSLFVTLQAGNAPTPVSGERFDVSIWGYLL